MEFATSDTANSQAAPQRGLGYKSLLRYREQGALQGPLLSVLWEPP
jgi:hypothetical protein